MANSASDAGNSEKVIRVKLIESGIISQMVTLPSNMFTSVTLPATLWFFDKAKAKKDEILFIDARNVFTQIDRAHRKFSDEQIRNLGIITRLYEGKTEDFDALLADYRAKLADAPEMSDDEDIMPKSYWQSNIDWLTERFPSKIDGCVNVILYYGSSTYDTAQMSRLIELIIQDCKALDIETATPAELSLLLERWDG